MRKLACFALPFSLSVFLVQYLLPDAAVLPLGIFCAVLAPLCLWIAPKGDRRLGAILALAGLSFGLFWCAGYQRVVYAPAEAMDGTTVRLEGTVADWPKETDYGISVTVRIRTGGPVPVNAVVYADGAYAGLRPGDRISTVAGCRRATWQHGEEVTYYISKGVFLVANAYGTMTVDRPERVPLLSRPALLTRALQNGLERTLPEEEAALAKALTTGDKTGLSDTFISQLRRDGLSHVVVVSGLHLSVLLWTVLYLLGPYRRSSAVISGLLVILVMAMAGGTPSVVRAGILQVFMILGPLWNRNSDHPTTLSLALMVLLLANPFAAANVGLQLSFAAVTGLYLFGAPLRELLLTRLLSEEKILPARLWNLFVKLIATSLAAALAAQVFTIPLCAYYFGTISLIAPLANVLVLWAVFPAFTLSLLAGALPVAGQLAARIALPFLRYILSAVPKLARIPLAAVTTNSVYYVLWLCFAYLLLGVTLLWQKQRRWLPPICCGAAGLAAAVLCTSLSFQAGEVTVSVLDVGQGQSVLLRAGDHYALVDCGGDSDQNPGDIAADALSDIGKTQLDLLVLTHFHADHANGIPQLLERVSVVTLAVPDVEPDDPLRQEILTKAEAAGTEILFIDEDTAIPMEGGGTLRLYAPLGRGETNEEGLTVLCSSGEFDVLLTGDMNSEVEQLLLAHTRLPDIEVLIAGHHGSKHSTSEELLAAVKPELTVVSAGRNNRYGHPAPETLARLAQIGAEVRRTDLNGTVTIHA